MARLTNVWCMSPTTEILAIGTFVSAHAASQCYWYFVEGETDRILGSVETKGHFAPWEDKIIRSALYGVEFFRNAITPVQLMCFVLMFHTLLFKKSPAWMVPWLLMGGVKDILLGAILALMEAFLCYVIGLPKQCTEVTVFLAVELALNLYLWGSALLLYQELANREIAEEGDVFWSSTTAAASEQPTVTPSDWEEAPAGLRTSPKRRLDESVPSMADNIHESGCSEEETRDVRPSKKRAVQGELTASGRSVRPRVNKAVQANTLSRRWLLANSVSPVGSKSKEGSSTRSRKSTPRAEAAGTSTPQTRSQSRSQYTHRDVSPRVAAATVWASDGDDVPLPQQGTS